MPVTVTPYHYRNADQTLSNTTHFKELVLASRKGIVVDLLNFYPHGPVGAIQPAAVYAHVETTTTNP